MRHMTMAEEEACMDGEHFARCHGRIPTADEARAYSDDPRCVDLYVAQALDTLASDAAGRLYQEYPPVERDAPMVHARADVARIGSRADETMVAHGCPREELRRRFGERPTTFKWPGEGLREAARSLFASLTEEQVASLGAAHPGRVLSVWEACCERSPLAMGDLLILPEFDGALMALGWATEHELAFLRGRVAA